ncbi:GntR family transcriptional regulator [Rhodobacteraceae bacterium RKSG542]|uniref:GntR family transcriptional regulator n=1 Tax=Pseudovibrio flavus TaxID=2529854 RepID=UPI0012BC72D4|nr:GntR family transcriptional regulator [Pseudovibrio flavus]MTI17986.1 GntR family transcriptional regulator [Pseudovibrio flavus]
MTPKASYKTIYGVLRDSILDGALHHNYALNETDTARYFKVGRTPVREAFKLLIQEKLIVPAAGRGFLVAFGPEHADINRSPLSDMRVRMNAQSEDTLKIRSVRERLYPQMEREIACIMRLGEFQLTELDVSAHLGVGRTVVRDLLTRLERIGLVRQNNKGRWFTVPLTKDRISDYYEMRILLEPAALILGVGRYSRTILEEKVSRLRRGRENLDSLTGNDFYEFEMDLHVGVLKRCPNEEMRHAIYRSQIPLINVSFSPRFHRDIRGQEMLLDEHEAVLNRIIERKPKDASELLREHLELGRTYMCDNFDRIRDRGHIKIPPYLRAMED